MRTLFLLTTAFLVLALSSVARAEDGDFLGLWDVNTRFVGGSGPVNPDYKPGDIRAEVWQIDAAGGQPTLTTHNGTIPGRIANGQARFGADVPIGQIIVMRIVVDGFLTSGGSMKGTIGAEYWDRRFGTKVGLDSWTYEGLKR